MDAFAKRPRPYSSNQRDFHPSYANQPEYYDESDELGVEDPSEEEGEELDYDPHTELQYRRAELDNRLKNTFESIFAKYERDFDGIGDEIDLATGEIVVNNGHLIEMLDERDAGLRKARTTFAHDAESIADSAEGDQYVEEGQLEGSGEDGEEEEEEEEDEDEDEEEEDDDDNEEGDGDTTTGESMDDDDLILRGFTQANRFLKASPELGLPEENYYQPSVPRSQLKVKSKPRQAIPHRTHSSHADILAQFGPQLGQQIVGYISQQEQASRDSHVEPAWRVPEIPSVPAKFRPSQQPCARIGPTYRSPSPDASPSIWAAPGMRGNKFKIHNDSHPKRIRNSFTQEEDEAMLEYVAKARQKGTPLFSTLLWKGLEAKFPRHKWNAWQVRYKRNFYLSTDTDKSGGESTADYTVRAQAKPNITTLPYQSFERSHRERKPAQRDSRIITWSEAVDTIASVDPDLHAGILDDARKAKNGEESWMFGQPKGPARGRPVNPPEPNMNRPSSAHEVDPLQRNFIARHQSHRRFSDTRMAMSGPSNSQLLLEQRKTDPMVPCPHAKCRHLSTILYKLERAAHEDVSEMTLHLLRVHHTTPFPCGEAGCLQAGERGYFMQEELVNHVKTAHPSAVALRRLRGRVSDTLLDGIKRICIDLTSDSPLMGEKPAEEKGSKLLFAGNGISQGVGDYSTPDNERSSTPTAFGERENGAASIWTPLTSFSSLAVHHSSAEMPRWEVSDSQEPSELPAGKNAPANNFDLLRNEVPFVRATGSPLATSSKSGPIPRYSGRSRSLSNQSFHQPTKMDSNPTMDHFRRSDPSADLIEVAPEGRLTGNEALLRSDGPVAPDSASIVQTPSRAPGLHAVNDQNIRKRSAPKKSRMPEKFIRNTVHPSHEFSDEEDPIPPPRTATNPKSVAKAETMGASAAPPVTPSTKRQPRKSAVQTVLGHDDEVDELSLGPDDFKIISSTTRSMPNSAFMAPLGIKREATVGPSFSEVTTSKKRKIDDVSGNDDIDELGADECFGKSTTTRIKREVDLEGTPMTYRIKAQRKRVKKGYREEARKGTMGPPSQIGSGPSRHLARSSTPLLDLTPDKALNFFGNLNSGHEIPDSDDSPVPPSSVPQGPYSPFDGLLTPSRSKQGSDDPLKSAAGTTYVVKTPGGTYRRCGEGLFRCGRSFCFRCSHSELGVKI